MKASKTSITGREELCDRGQKFSDPGYALKEAKKAQGEVSRRRGKQFQDGVK